MKTNMITERFQNPQSFAQNRLQYYVKNGKHTIVHAMHAGEDMGPNCYRFDAIEDARKMFRTLRRSIINRGYAPVCCDVEAVVD